MDAVTYPNEPVADFINEKFVAVRIRNDEQPYADNYLVSWTPRIIVLDPLGRIHKSTVGFFPPKEFIPALIMGLAKIDFYTSCLDECLKHLDCVINSHPKSGSAPEAVYYKGVTEYKISGKAGSLKEAYHRLKKEYPGSEWLYRAAPYRLL